MPDPAPLDELERLRAIADAARKVVRPGMEELEAIVKYEEAVVAAAPSLLAAIRAADALVVALAKLPHMDHIRASYWADDEDKVEALEAALAAFNATRGTKANTGEKA